MYCSKCGCENVEESKYCCGCGVTLENDKPVNNRGINKNSLKNKLWNSPKKQARNIVLIVLFILVLCVVGYSKYADYKLNHDIKKVINTQSQKKDNVVISEYNNLLAEYDNNSKVYSSLSAYYVSKDKLDKAIDVLYVGLDKNKDNNQLIESLGINIKNAKVQDGYLRVTKGSAITSSDKVSVQIEGGSSVYLKLNIDASIIDTSKEGFTEIECKEKYTGHAINLGIEVVEFTGNTMGNNLIGGKMAFKDGWIYFRDPSSGGLYKMKEDLSRKTKLDGAVEPQFINVVDNNLYFIDVKSGEYGSVVKTDLEGRNKQVLRENTGYMYIIGDSIYYSETTSENNGWQVVALNKMNFKYEDVEKNISTSTGYIQVLNSKYSCSTNKYGTFIQEGKNNPTWGDSNNYKYLTSAEIYKGEIYGNIANASTEKTGFGKLDIEHNTQDVTIENVSSFNSIGKDVYYANDDGIFMATIDGLNEVRLMEISEETNKISLYNIGNKMYSYSDEIRIVEKSKQEIAVNTDIPDIKNQDIINLCNDASKLLLDIEIKRNSDEIQIDTIFYSGLDEPYTSIEKIRDALSKYFTEASVKRITGGKTFIEKDEKLYYMSANSGEGGVYTYTSIKSRTNKGSVIQASSYAKYSEDNSSADNGDIELKVEEGEWKIDSFDTGR